MLSADGQVPPRTLTEPPATSDTLDVWTDARDAARQFWNTASHDARLSSGVRQLCVNNADLLAGVRGAR